MSRVYASVHVYVCITTQPCVVGANKCACAQVSLHQSVCLVHR